MRDIIMAKNWREVRKEAVTRGLIDEDKVAEQRARMLAEVRAYRLAEIRKSQNVTQVQLAQAMEVTQSRVSRLEKGMLAASELGTVKKYVEALGGQLRLVADFGAAGVLPLGDPVAPSSAAVDPLQQEPGRRRPAAATPVSAAAKMPAASPKKRPAKLRSPSAPQRRAAG
jgi:transcriptional regulator with XRE-family HTH domain